MKLIRRHKGEGLKLDLRANSLTRVNANAFVIASFTVNALGVARLSGDTVYY